MRRLPWDGHGVAQLACRSPISKDHDLFDFAVYFEHAAFGPVSDVSQWHSSGTALARYSVSADSMIKSRLRVLRAGAGSAATYETVQAEAFAIEKQRQQLNEAQAGTGQAGSAMQMHNASIFNESDDPFAAVTPAGKKGSKPKGWRAPATPGGGPDRTAPRTPGRG